MPRAHRLGRLDLLDCGARRAANGVNAGFAAAATERLSRRVKRALGPLADAVGGLLAGVAPPTWPARVEVDGQVVEGAALAVVVGNGGSFGGGRRLLPDADPADGLLDVLVVPAGHSKARLARGLASHRLDGLPRLRGREATVTTAMPCRLDGEPAPTPPRIRVLPGAWRVLNARVRISLTEIHTRFITSISCFVYRERVASGRDLWQVRGLPAGSRMLPSIRLTT